MKRGSETLLRARLAVLLGILSCSCGLLGLDRPERTLDVEYAGHEAFSERELDRILARFFKDFPDSRFKKSAVDDAAFDLERAYLAAGYPRVRVQYAYTEDGRARPLAAFAIDEGPHVELVGVTFEGASAFRTSELEAFFAPPVTGLLEESRRDYVQSSVKAAAVELELAYQSRGYLAALVEIRAVELDPSETRATVHVRVREGQRCTVLGIEIGCDDPRIDVAEFERVRAAFVGLPYYERLSVEIQGRIEEACAQSGFGDVRVTRTKREIGESGGVRLSYAVELGPRITVGDVQVQGNAKTRPDFVRSRLVLRPGERFTREKERTSYGRLFRSGVFDRIGIRTVPAPDEDRSSAEVIRDVRVDVSESPAIETYVEPGWGSYEELRFAAGARHKNLFGTGRILDFQGVLAQRAQTGQLSLIDPWLFESDVVADISLFGKRRREPSFLRLEQGVRATLTRRFTRRTEGSVGYELRNSRAADVQILDAEARSVIDQVDISELQASYSFDTRDSAFQPTEGSSSKLGFEYGSALLGSELEFARLKAQHATFVPLDQATVLGVSARLGLVLPLGATATIPLQERFFNGGENSVRSFRESELGPKDDEGEPIGGETFTNFSLELRRRLRGRLEGALFYDVGNVGLDHQELLRFDDLRQGIGAGLRYLLPVGPIRLDAAWNPDPGDFESSFVVHVSLGMSF